MSRLSVSPEALSVAQQTYVEAIAELAGERGATRTTDLAEKLSVSLPSVSEAVTRLVELGVAERPSRYEIALTRRGQKIADQLDRRHGALCRFMTDVLVMDPESADELACRIEHAVSRDLTDRILRLAEFMHHEADPDVVERLKRFMRG